MNIPNTEKRPDSPRQENSRTAQNSEPLEGEPMMSKSTANEQHVQAHGTRVNIDPATWQPGWCLTDPDACGPETHSPSEPMHYSAPAKFVREDGRSADFGTIEDGEGFTASARRIMMISSLDGGPDEASMGLGVRLDSPDDSPLGIYMSTFRARQLADWLTAQADAMDAWAAEHESELGGEAQ